MHSIVRKTIFANQKEFDYFFHHQLANSQLSLNVQMFGHPKIKYCGSFPTLIMNWAFQIANFGEGALDFLTRIKL